jgi:hypothetical protein
MLQVYRITLNPRKLGRSIRGRAAIRTDEPSDLAATPTRLELLAKRLDVDSAELRRWLQAEVQRRRQETADEERPRRP